MASPVVLLRRVGLYLFCAVLITVFFTPLYLMVITSFKDERATPKNLLLVGWFNMGNYTAFLQPSGASSGGNPWFAQLLWRSAKASLAYSASTTFVTLAVASMSGYALAKRRFRGRHLILFILVASALIPEALTVFPNLSLVAKLGLRGKFWGLVLPRLASPLAVLICWRAMASIPAEFVESARLDTDSEWSLFARVILPLSRPALAALGVLLFVLSWNETLWPLFMRFSRDGRLLSTIAPSLFWFLRASSWGNVMAVVVVISSPILAFYILFYERLNDAFVSEGAKMLKPWVLSS